MSGKKADQTLGWIVLCFLGAALSTQAAAPDVLHVHAAEFPCPAVRTAAKEFSQRYGVHVDVDSRTAGEWPREAELDADVIFANSESLMAELIEREALQIDEASVIPLYLRSASIFARPGNPHAIRGFSDLLRPGIRIMVVNDSAQFDLWQDIAHGQQDPQPSLAFLENVAVFAPTSHEALQIWKQGNDVDVWVKWNHWYKPPHYSAELVKPSTESHVYRRGCLALTRRGMENPLAKNFVDFLASPTGEEIFESWHWIPTQGKSDLVAVLRSRPGSRVGEKGDDQEPAGTHGRQQQGSVTRTQSVGQGK